MKIEDLDVPPEFCSELIKSGIEELYPPQEEAIKKGILDGSNLVVAIPTASGKTLIAILAIFKQILTSPGTKAIYLAPLRALASEKFEEFRKLAKPLGIKVAISTGDLDDNSKWLSRADIIIATNEKFDSLIRHQASWLNDIRIIVSDEVHLINDSSRGPVLEVVLSLILRNLPECQIVALSATIINADEIADWLEAKLILSSWRPVKLREGVYESGSIKYANGEKQKVGSKSDKNGYDTLSLEIISQGGQALIFANTRKSAMATADKVGAKLKKQLTPAELEILSAIAKKIRSTGENTQLRERLAKSIEHGVAFHHAGLNSSHRKIVEKHFKSRDIKIITATPTLAAGVNLPGRRVIIRSLSRYSQGFGYSFIPVLEYKQMAGRAGRPRYDPYGEAIIIAKNEEEADMYLDRYIRAETEEIYSKLGYEPALRSHILAFIAAHYVHSFESALDMLGITFYGFQNEGSMYLVEEEVLKVFDLLTEAKMITPNEPYEVTPFGKRVNELYLDPLSARLIKLGLESVKDKKSIPQIVYLQLLSSTPDIRSYSVRKNDMPKLIDIAEEYSGQWIEILGEEQNEFSADFFFAQLKVAKIIDLWLEEATEEEIYVQYGVTSGDIHAILQRSEWLVYCSAEIAKIFDWKIHRKFFLGIQKRIKYGVSKDLLPLVEIKGVGRIRARTLYNAGYTKISELKKAKIEDLSKLSNIGPSLAASILNFVLEEDVYDVEQMVEEEIDEPSQSTLSTYF